MSELILPHSIDTGTPITAIEHQANYTAIRDWANGEVEGGSGAEGNIKANGITARELADAILINGVPPLGSREGLASQPVANVTGLYVSPGAGLTLNYGAGTVWIRDDSGLFAATALIPATITAGSVVVPANASGNPRLDQVIATLTGYGTATVSVLQGTPDAAATLNTRTGAAALPSDAIRLADALTTNGFAGPYVDHTSLRNRIPWAVPMKFTLAAATELANVVIDSQTQEFVDIQYQLETSVFPSLHWTAEGSVAAVYGMSADEAQLTTPSTVTRAVRGGWSLTAGNLSVSPSAVSAGGLKLSGRGQMSTKIVGTNFLTFTGDAAASSLTGSGSHVLSDYHIASTWAPGTGGIASYLRFFVASGTMTGHFVLDRVPML